VIPMERVMSGPMAISYFGWLRERIGPVQEQVWRHRHGNSLWRHAEIRAAGYLLRNPQKRTGGISSWSQLS
jgi:hypothetical protein